MKFKLVKRVDGEVNCYGRMCKTGGAIELDGWLAEKAQKNPDFAELISVQKKAKKNGVKS